MPGSRVSARSSTRAPGSTSSTRHQSHAAPGSIRSGRVRRAPTPPSRRSTPPRSAHAPGTVYQPVSPPSPVITSQSTAAGAATASTCSPTRGGVSRSAKARRTASAYGVGPPGGGPAGGVPRQTSSCSIDSSNGPARCRSTGRTAPSARAVSRGAETGTGTSTGRGCPAATAQPATSSPNVSTSGPPTSKVALTSGGRVRQAVRWWSTSSMPMGWVWFHARSGIASTGPDPASVRIISKLAEPAPITIPAWRTAVGARPASRISPTSRRDARCAEFRGPAGCRPPR